MFAIEYAKFFFKGLFPCSSYQTINEFVCNSSKYGNMSANKPHNATVCSFKPLLFY